MTKADFKDSLIIGFICMLLSVLSGFVIYLTFVEIFDGINKLDFSFLMNDDFSDYQDMQIKISIVPDEQIKEDLKPEPEIQHHLPEHAFHVIRGMSNSRIYRWELENPLDCQPAHYIPTVRLELYIG